MGIVPGDLRRLGLEGAGVVRRVGGKVTSLSVGQRVAVYRRGCFANRVQSPIQGVHSIPDSMSFEVQSPVPFARALTLMLDSGRSQASLRMVSSAV